MSKIKVAADMDIAETRIPQDGRMTERIGDEPVDLRVSTLPSLHGEKIVIRLLPHKNPFQELRDLGLEGQALLTYYNWIKKPQGMVLITGQTGSGKTSTLYTTLSHILNTEKNVVTIEDPIEFQLKGATQVQVQPKVGLTFAYGLRSILRQDPDTILLGEIRDGETAGIAYQAALTGHLVLSTLHTNDAPSAIIRLMDIQVEPYLIASATLGVVAQRLIRRVCIDCAQTYYPGQDLLRSLHLDTRQDYLFYKAVGCETCFQTGYYGREGIFEVMPIDEELSNLITHKEQLNTLRAHLQERKVQSLYEAAIAKVVRGLTTVDEIHRVIPPTQQIQRPTSAGSVFVYILFLMSILSVLIINMASLFDGGIGLLKQQKQAMQSSYGAQAALAVGEFVLKEKLKTGALYLTTQTVPVKDPLQAIPELADWFTHIQSIPLALTDIRAQYQVEAKLNNLVKPGLYDYTYRLSGIGQIARHPEIAASPVQQLSGIFQIETGPIPLSLFERYASAGTIEDAAPQKHAGPWYSAQPPTTTQIGPDDRPFPIPPRGYFSNQSLPIQLPSSLWPVLPGANRDSGLSFSRPALLLTPVQASSGTSYVLGQSQHALKAFHPDFENWALMVQGNVDRLVLQADQPNHQTIEFNQLSGINSPLDAAGYRKLTLLKSIVAIDEIAQKVSVLTQTWELTVNPQRQITNQRMLHVVSEQFNHHFQGLIQVYGAIQQVVGGDSSDQSAYAVPMSIFATDDIGISQSIQAHPQSPAACLGLISPEGHIKFQPLTPSSLAMWDTNTESTLSIQAALTAGQFVLPKMQAIQVKGSVAVTKDVFPAALMTEADNRLYHLALAPPFYPTFDKDKPGVLVTQAPTTRHWHLGEEPQ